MGFGDTFNEKVQGLQQNLGSSQTGVMGAFNDESGKRSRGNGQYRVMQVVLREKFVGKGSKNFTEIEDLCNQQFAEGYRLHTFAQSTANSTGFGGGDRTVCNLVFERM